MACPTQRLDPKNDLVFKLLLTRAPALLAHMLEGILGRPLLHLEIIDPKIPGDLTTDKHIILDIRAVLADGSRTDVEMQMRNLPGLATRLVYYAARDYAAQLQRGDGYDKLTPTVGIVWLLEPLFPQLDHLHSIFELRDRRSHTRLSDHLSIHLLQLSNLHPSATTEYDVRVERWARFLMAKTDAQLDQLAREDPMMDVARRTLDTLSMDPEAHRRAREREDSIKLYEMSLRASEAQGEARGVVRGKVEVLLDLLQARFGALPELARARLHAATPEQLDTWVGRVLTAPSLDAVLAQ